MPDMDGEMLGGRIKSDETLRDITLVMLTSLGHTGDAIRLKAAGFSAYLHKPARQSELLSTLVSVWAARNAGQATESDSRHPVVGHINQQENPTSCEGKRVLVAEDNIVNQKVATMMLQSLGCYVEIAANGREALRMLDTTPFDIVFMDCEMPDMDGYEATAEIRRSEDKRHLPIIAVTAKATKGDRDYCLQAGMDDYMSKPVKLQDFQAALERWSPKISAEDTGTSPTNKTPVETRTAETCPALDDEIVARLRDLALATDPSLLNQILRRFWPTVKHDWSLYATQRKKTLRTNCAKRPMR
jgi:CheY-like chemotaxis protein